MCPKFFKNTEALNGHVVAVHPKAVCPVCKQVGHALASHLSVLARWMRDKAALLALARR
jgi:hypothetical protein